MSANRHNDEIVYAPQIISDEVLWHCKAVIEEFNGHGTITRRDLGTLIETLDTLYQAVKKLQGVGYIVALRAALKANLDTHANVPIWGSKRREDMDAGKPRKEWHACDCSLCVDARVALAGGPGR